MKERPGGGLLLKPGTLWEALTERTARALSTGALQPIPTTFEFIEEGGLRFHVRILANLVRKDEERWRREREAREGEEENPFLPYDEELFVADLTETHLCLLNKFNVVENHLLIVTREFEDQDRYLTEADFGAMLAGLAEYEGLAFYNGGTVAGASQRHKHLQLVSLPLAPGEARIPIDGLISEACAGREIGASAVLPFRHAAAPTDPRWLRSPLEAAVEALALYRKLLQAVGMERHETPLKEIQSGPYNFLMTREWMFLVPRSGEFFDGMSINSLGFAGALLVRNESELAALRKKGPMAALAGVSVPLSSPSGGGGG